jgi:hypothetical protein
MKNSGKFPYLTAVWFLLNVENALILYTNEIYMIFFIFADSQGENPVKNKTISQRLPVVIS